jgi:hypothetical protein
VLLLLVLFLLLLLLLLCGVRAWCQLPDGRQLQQPAHTGETHAHVQGTETEARRAGLVGDLDCSQVGREKRLGAVADRAHARKAPSGNLRPSHPTTVL